MLITTLFLVLFFLWCCWHSVSLTVCLTNCTFSNILMGFSFFNYPINVGVPLDFVLAPIDSSDFNYYLCFSDTILKSICSFQTVLNFYSWASYRYISCILKQTWFKPYLKCFYKPTLKVQVPLHGLHDFTPLSRDI